MVVILLLEMMMMILMMLNVMQLLSVTWAMMCDVWRSVCQWNSETDRNTRLGAWHSCQCLALTNINYTDSDFILFFATCPQPLPSECWQTWKYFTYCSFMSLQEINQNEQTERTKSKAPRPGRIKDKERKIHLMTLIMRQERTELHPCNFPIIARVIFDSFFLMWWVGVGVEIILVSKVRVLVPSRPRCCAAAHSNS